MSVHMSIKYLCNECEYNATTKSSLKIHKMSVHENVKFPCNQCDNTKLQKKAVSKPINYQYMRALSIIVINVSPNSKKDVLLKACNVSK